jgi:hypothetical protein
MFRIKSHVQWHPEFLCKVSLEYKLSLCIHLVIFFEDKRGNWVRIQGISYVARMIICIKNMIFFLHLVRLSQLRYVTFLTHFRFSVDWQVISASRQYVRQCAWKNSRAAEQIFIACDARGFPTIVFRSVYVFIKS